ncbi:MAG: MotA/TolQ/ExbB proton channel family protein [Pseudomonadota bacterium]
MNVGRFPRLLLSVFFTVAPATGLAQDAVADSLLADIRRSTERLERAEKDIADAAARLNQQISEAQQEVGDLRRRATELQRAADEQTVGIDVLQARLEKWQQQEQYQQNLLLELERRVAYGAADRIGEANEAARLQSALALLNERLNPTFQPAGAFTEAGAETPGQQLSLGPLSWFVHAAGGGMLGSREDNLSQVVWAFDSDALEELRGLQQNNAGVLMLDPTQGRYLALREARSTLLEHLGAGGVWVIPILTFALLSLAIALIKVVQFLRLPRLNSEVEQSLINQLRSPVRDAEVPRLLEPLISIWREAGSEQQREDRLFDFLVDQRNRLQRLLGAVAITATVSPLLGLLGTVSGMIRTFQSMTVFGSGDPSAVSGGISEALVTTEMGLIVAVPSLVIHALLKRKADSYAGQLESLVARVDERVTA